MKKAFVLVVLAMVLILSCAAQSTNDQRIVGTWDTGGTVWVFNANGTGSFEGNNFNYAISANGNIYISTIGRGDTLYMSPDGRRMFIYGAWFEKK